MKSSYYVAVTTSVYRRAVDLLAEDREKFKEELPHLLEELEKVSHRPYTLGFLKGGDEILQHYETSSYIRNYTFLAIYRNGKWEIRNRLRKGDEVELFFPDASVKKEKVKRIKVLREDTEDLVSEVHPNYRATIEFEEPISVPENTILRRKKLLQNF